MLNPTIYAKMDFKGGINMSTALWAAIIFTIAAAILALGISWIATVFLTVWGMFVLGLIHIIASIMGEPGFSLWNGFILLAFANIWIHLLKQEDGRYGSVQDYFIGWYVSFFIFVFFYWLLL